MTTPPAAPFPLGASVMTERREAPRGRLLRISAGIVVGLALWRGADCLFGANTSSIVAHEAYRSAQLDAGRLREQIAAVGVRSVINLRGESDSPWYREEIAVCNAAGVAHYDVPLSARRLPDPASAARLAALLREAPRPILIHCLNGADRTGLASAMFLIQNSGMDAADAGKAGLTPWHGHIALGATAQMDRFLALYRDRARGKPLEAWIREDYPAIFAREQSRNG